MLLVHSPDAEQTFMKEGHGFTRESVMHNDFVLVGPPERSGQGRRAPAASTQALQAIAETKSAFASRADDSGTNAKELKLWEQAGITRRLVVPQDRAGHGTDADHRLPEARLHAL